MEKSFVLSLVINILLLIGLSILIYYIYIQYWCQGSAQLCPSAGYVLQTSCNSCSASTVCPAAGYTTSMSCISSCAGRNYCNSNEVQCPSKLTATRNGCYFKTQTDGNLVIYNSRGTAVWSSKTSNSGIGPYISYVENSDGKLILKDSTGTILWSSTGTSNYAPYLLYMQDDCNLVIYDSKGTALWSSGTSGQF